MKAAILTELNKPLVIADVDLPSLQNGQVLVQVMCSGICGSQIGEIDGAKGPDKYLPHLLGHEGGGVVKEIGPGVTRVKKDDRVVLHWRKGEGIESSAPKYKWGEQTVNAGWVTTFNEYAVVSENRLTSIPNDIDFEIAALMGCSITTGMGVIKNDAKLQKGESVVVFGVGGVGLSIIQGAALAKAKTIIAVDLHEHKLKLAEEFGANHLIQAQTDIREKILEITEQRGPDVAIDTTGVIKVIEMAYEVTAAQGRTILVGVPKAGEKVSIYTLPLHFGKILTGSHGGSSNPSVDIPEYLKLYKEGRLKLEKMITHHFSLDEINIAIDKIRQGEVGRCIIKTS